ncbi:MAG: right-handed parallel beta-helix repeat-containing protein [Armatimonadetes bacterium]|nr:right-handed parallel beta-helix repeat-containing protein [Armatimonadota bacterium]
MRLGLIRFNIPLGFLICALLVGTSESARAQYDIYRANLHVHILFSCEAVPYEPASWDHCFSQVPSDAMTSASAEGLDVIGFSDHGGAIDSSEWTALGYTADAHQNPPGPVALRGFEWTLSGGTTSDHVNVFGTASYTDTQAFGSGTPPTYSTTLPALYSWLKSASTAPGYGDRPLAQFNHIFWGTHLSNFANWDEDLDSIFCLAEIGCGEAPFPYSSGTNPNGVSGGANPANSEQYFRTALQAGWHVGPSIGIDNQSGVGDQAATRHTAIWVVPGSGRAGVMDALRRRRVFASEDIDFSLRLRCQVDGQSSWYWMGDVIPAGASGFTFEVTAFDPNQTDPWKDYFASIDLMCSGRSNPIRSWGSVNDTYFSDTFHLSYQELRALPMTSQGETALYLRIRQTGTLGAEQDYVYSAPAWVHNYTPVPGTITTNITWKASGSPYVVNYLTIAAGTRLTIEPGAVVKFATTTPYWGFGRIDIKGSLVADGTAESPIYFTDVRDDSVGGDTNGDAGASSPSRGEWHHIAAMTAGASALFDHCIVKYGGSSACGFTECGHPAANIGAESGGQVTVTNCTITESYYAGISVDGAVNPQIADCSVINNGLGISLSNCGTPSVSGCTISANNGYGVNLASCLSPTMSSNRFIGNASYAAVLNGAVTGDVALGGNTASGNRINGLYLSCYVPMSGRLRADAGFPYVVGGWLGVSPGATLTIDPGTVVKFDKNVFGTNGAIGVQGSLIAQGTPESLISFTSLKDDALGGDTNNDVGATTPVPGDWGFVYVNGSGASGVFDYCIVRYGGYYYYDSPKANLACKSGGTITVRNCSVTKSQYVGIYSEGLQQTVKNSIVAYNGSYGVYLIGGSPQVLYCDIWSNGTNYYGSPDLTGTIFADPLFVNLAGGDYRLQDTSRCIDSGDPAILDPDGTRVDLGAIPNLGGTMCAAKLKGDGEQVSLARGVVSAAFSDYYYVESNNRSNGIRVVQPGHSIAAGTQVTVSGFLRTNLDGERYIESGPVSQHGNGSVEPLFANNRSLGGSDWVYDPLTGIGQQGITAGLGLNNIGLLVKTAGRITRIGEGYIYLDDGSPLIDGTLTEGVPNTGVRIECDPTAYLIGDYLVVTGISSCFRTSSDKIAPRLLTSRPDDVRKIGGP